MGKGNKGIKHGGAGGTSEDGTRAQEAESVSFKQVVGLDPPEGPGPDELFDGDSFVLTLAARMCGGTYWAKRVAELSPEQKGCIDVIWGYVPPWRVPGGVLTKAAAYRGWWYRDARFGFVSDLGDLGMQPASPNMGPMSYFDTALLGADLRQESGSLSEPAVALHSSESDAALGLWEVGTPEISVVVPGALGFVEKDLMDFDLTRGIIPGRPVFPGPYPSSQVDIEPGGHYRDPDVAAIVASKDFLGLVQPQVAMSMAGTWLSWGPGAPDASGCFPTQGPVWRVNGSHWEPPYRGAMSSFLVCVVPGDDAWSQGVFMGKVGLLQGTAAGLKAWVRVRGGWQDRVTGLLVSTASLLPPAPEGPPSAWLDLHSGALHKSRDAAHELLSTPYAVEPLAWAVAFAERLQETFPPSLAVQPELASRCMDSFQQSIWSLQLAQARSDGAAAPAQDGRFASCLLGILERLKLGQLTQRLEGQRSVCSFSGSLGTFTGSGTTVESAKLAVAEVIETSEAVFHLDDEALTNLFGTLVQMRPEVSWDTTGSAQDSKCTVIVGDWQETFSGTSRAKARIAGARAGLNHCDQTRWVLKGFVPPPAPKTWTGAELASGLASKAWTARGGLKGVPANDSLSELARNELWVDRPVDSVNMAVLSILGHLELTSEKTLVPAEGLTADMYRVAGCSLSAQEEVVISFISDGGHRSPECSFAFPVNSFVLYNPFGELQKALEVVVEVGQRDHQGIWAQLYRVRHRGHLLPVQVMVARPMPWSGWSRQPRAKEAVGGARAPFAAGR
jgi:hypothetical protein